MRINFEIGKSVVMKTGETGVVSAIELVSPNITDGLGIFVGNEMEKVLEAMPVYEATGNFTLRYGIKKEFDEKIRFYFEQQIVGGVKHPFGKGGL